MGADVHMLQDWFEFFYTVDRSYWKTEATHLETLLVEVGWAVVVQVSISPENFPLRRVIFCF